MAELFLSYARLPGADRAYQVVRDAKRHFEMIAEFSPGGFQSAEVTWSGSLGLFRLIDGFEARWVHCQSELRKEVDGTEKLASLLTDIPPPPYRFELSFEGKNSPILGADWWLTLGVDRQTAFIIATPPSDRQDEQTLAWVIDLLRVPLSVRGGPNGFEIVDAAGAPVRSTILTSSGSPGDFRVSVDCRSWGDLIERARPLAEQIWREESPRWSAVLGHERRSDQADLGGVIFAEVASFGLPTRDVLLLLEYRLSSLEAMDALSPVLENLEQGAFRARLCQFRVNEDEVASIDALLMREGSYLELEVRNPEVVPEIEAALGVRFEGRED